MEVVLEFEQEAEARELDKGAFAIFTDLIDNYDTYLEDEAEAERIAAAIAEAVNDVDTGFEGWQTNERTLNDIEIAIIDALVKNFDKAALVKTDDFVSDARGYLVRNKVAGEDGS